ncbi:MAG: nucleotide exchange factor GrpE, partial [Limnochordia bacterium]
IRATANQNLLTGLLPVIDNFERAIAAGEEDSPYLAGVRMIFNQLMECLQKEGLAPVDAVGKPFDPTVHEAVSMEGGPGEDLIVIEELQKGYYYKDKLLRASMVKVAPKQQHEEE